MKNVLLVIGLVLIFSINVFANDDFIEAAGNGDLAKVQEYLNSAVDINVRNNLGWTAIISAAYSGNTSVVEYLLNRGADIGDGAALVIASEKGYIEIVKLLLTAGASVSDGVAFITAVVHGQIEVVKLLINAQVDVNIIVDIYPFGVMSALIMAAGNGNVEIVKLLINAGADVNIENHGGSLALMWASYCGHTEIVEILKAAGATN